MKLPRMLRKATPPRLRLEDRYREIIARLAPGNSFVDVGCMWAVNGGYAFHADASGATTVTGFDINEASPEFLQRNAASGNRVRFVQGDVNEPSLEKRIGTFDAVFCVSVLNHAPHPLATLQQLRRLARKFVIVGSPMLPERDLPQAAMFVPFLDQAGRKAVNTVLGIKGRKPGLDSEFAPWRSYANWFWVFTPGCMRAMLRAASCEVVEAYEYPRYGCYVTMPTTGGLPLDGTGDPRPLGPPERAPGDRRR